MNEKTYQIADFIDKQLPPDILEQLKIIGRVKQYLKPTTTSAVSQAEDQPEIASDGSSPGLSTERELDQELDRLIDEVKDFENQVEQLEDLADEHLKDMAIPPANDMIADAVNQLGGKDGIITQEIFDRAQSIVDYTPLMSLGIDPVLAALIGDGSITGPRLKCAEIAPNLAKQLKFRPRGIDTAESTLEDMGQKMSEQHDKKMKDFMIEFILMLWWNQLWPKFVVDLAIINPLRQTYANPYDSYISFFLDFSKFSGECKNKKRFRFKSKTCVQGTAANSYADSKGPINQVLNLVRMILLCWLPRKFYPDYKPAIEIKCLPMPGPCKDNDIENDFESFGGIGAAFGKLLGQIMDIFNENTPCVDTESLAGQADKTVPTMFGCSPDCIKAAKIVLDAVMVDAFTPLGPVENLVMNDARGNNVTR